MLYPTQDGDFEVYCLIRTHVLLSSGFWQCDYPYAGKARTQRMASLHSSPRFWRVEPEVRTPALSV